MSALVTLCTMSAAVCNRDLIIFFAFRAHCCARYLVLGHVRFGGGWRLGGLSGGNGGFFFFFSHCSQISLMSVMWEDEMDDRG